MTVPDYKNDWFDSSTEKIAEIDDIELLSYLEKLQVYLFSNGFKDKEYNGLWNSLHNSFVNLATNHYDEIKNSLFYSLKRKKLCFKEIYFCNCILEKIALNNNRILDTSWSIEKLKEFWGELD